MPYKYKTYWVLDAEGKKHLTTRLELINPTAEERRHRAIMDRFMLKHGDALRRLARHDGPDQDS